MSVLVVGNGGAAYAVIAAARRRRECEEEELMTPYTPSELEEDWEFKIMRASTRAFRKHSELQRMLNEEAVFGWTLVEKFDDRRVRLKRPRSASENDAMSQRRGGDPYRTTYGISVGAHAGLILLCIFGGMALVATAVVVVKG